MYAEFFGLECLPFEDRADTKFFCETAECEDALAALKRQAREGKGLILLQGEAGTGKTLLIRTLLTRLDTSDDVVVVTVPSSGDMDLAREACKGFGVTLPAVYNKARGFARLRRHLVRAAKSGRRSILILDQAENMSSTGVGQLATLSDVQESEEKLLSIILVGQPRFRLLLDQPEFIRLRQRLYGDRSTPPLTLSDTAKYIRHRLEIAGAGRSNLFEEAALALIHKVSHGIPRLINHLCHAALLAAYGAREGCVTHRLAAQVTSGAAGGERSLGARDLGLSSVSDVVSGFPGAPPSPGSGRSQHEPLLPQSGSDFEYADATVDFDDGPGGFHPGGDSGAEPHFGVASPGVATASAIRSHTSEGTALVERLERVMARAERVGATTEASLAQQTAVEKHLTSLNERAERLLNGLADLVQRAPETLDRVRGRVESVLQEAEHRAETVETRATRVSELSSEAADQSQRVEDACDRADRVESHLTEYAEQLADRADTVQEQMTLLMTGVEAGEGVRTKLETSLAKAASAAAEAQKSAQTEQSKLQETVRESDRLRERFIAEALKHCREALEREVESRTREQLDAVEASHARFDAVLRRSSAVISNVDEKIDELGTALQESKSEGERFHKQFAGIALQNFRDSLQEQAKAQTDSHLQTIATAQATLDDTLARSSTIAKEVDKKIETLGTRLTDTLQDSERLHKQIAEASLARHQEQFGSLADTQTREWLEQVGAARNELDSVLRRNSDNVKEADTKTAALLATLQDTNEKIETLGTRLNETLQDSERLHKQIAEASLARHQEQFDSLTETQTRKWLEQIGTARNELDSLLKRSSETVKEADTKTDALLATLQETMVESEQLHNQFTNAALAGYRKKLHSHFEAHQAEHLEVLEAAQRDVRSLGEEASAIVTDARATLDADIDAQRTEAQRFLDSVRRDVTSLREQLETLESQRAQTHSSAGTLSETVHNAGSRIEELAAEVRQSQTTVEELVSHAGPVGNHLSDIVLRGEKLSVDVQSSCTQIETLQRSIANSLVQLGSAHERLDSVGDERKHCEQLVTQLTSASQHGDAVGQQLNKTVQDAAQVRDALDGLTVHGKDTRAELESCNGTAGDLVRELSETNPNIRELIEQVHRSTRNLEAVGETAHGHAEKCEQLVAQLTSATVDGNRVDEKLNDTVKAAGKAQEAAHRVSVDAEGKLCQLDSHTAAASDVLRRLSDTNVTGHNLLDAAAQASQDAKQISEDATREISRHIEEVWSLANKTEVTARELSQSNDDAGELLERLHGSTQPARTVLERLTGQAEKSARHSKELAERCAQAGNLVERLSSIAAVLRNAKDIDASIKETADGARAVHDELATAAKRAATQAANLENADASARGLIDTQTKLKQHTDLAAQRLTAQLEASDHSIESGQRLLREFTTQSEDVGVQIDALRRRAEQIEADVSQAIAKPEEIVATAQMQAAQLERVCGAVRKVFAGLSQAALEARNQTKLFERRREEASGQFAQLTTETHRASSTMHEWVEEAVRAQSRLEKTLRTCPSIGDTHPGSSLRNLPTIPEPPRQLAGHANNAVTTTPDRPGLDTPLAQKPASIAPSPTKAQEISGLIEDAKRAAGNPTP